MTPRQVTTMNNLPDELLTIIFEYLKIQDLVRCSLVCRRFKFICQEAKIPELIITNTIENIKEDWFYTNKQFNHQDAIDVTTFNIYQSIFRLDKFRRLYSEWAQLNVNDLTCLEQLKIHVEILDGVEHDIHINLPNLKMIENDTSSHIDSSRQRYCITTPKLEMLKCTNFDVINVTYPNTIKHLETDCYNESFHVLKNVQYLVVGHIGDFNWHNTLSAFPKLRKLDGHFGVNHIPTSIENLVKYNRHNQRSVPKIYCHSVEVDDVNKIDEYNRFPHKFLFQMNNYNSLAETVSHTFLDVDYITLMDTMNGEIPDDFFKKYLSTRSVNVYGKVNNQENLFRCLRNFQYLTTLWLGCDSLDQSFYDRVGELDQLMSVSVTLSSNTIFNFGFLLRLKRLRSFSTSLDSPTFFDLALELFRLLNYFSTIKFDFEGMIVRITKNRYYSFYSYRYKKCRLDFNGLVHEVIACRTRHVQEEKDLP